MANNIQTPKVRGLVFQYAECSELVVRMDTSFPVKNECGDHFNRRFVVERVQEPLNHTQIARFSGGKA